MKICYGWWVEAPCWFILLITGHDDGITLVGVRVLHCRNILQNRVVFRTTTYIKTYID